MPMIDEMRNKYANSRWNESIDLALKLSKDLRHGEKASMLEWAAWAAALKGDENLRKELHRKAAIIWEQLAVGSHSGLEKSMYYSKAAWDYNYHDYKHGSLIDLTIDWEAKMRCRRLAARYWGEVSEQCFDHEEKARYCGRAATHYFLLLDETNGNRYVNLAQRAWTDLLSELKGITFSSVEPLSEEFIDDVVSLEDGIPDFPVRPFEEHMQRTENYRRWIEAWVIRYKPERMQICFIESVKSPVANSWIEPKSRQDVELHSLVVRRAFRRKGIATKFLTELMKKFRDDGYENVLLGVAKSNLSAIPLYKRLGFVVVKEDERFFDMKLNLKEF